MFLLEWMSPLFDPQVMVSPQLLEVPPLELKSPHPMESEAPSQESTTSLSPHQTSHPFVQLSFWGMLSIHDSCEEFLYTTQMHPNLLLAGASSLIIWRHGSRWMLQKSWSAIHIAFSLRKYPPISSCPKSNEGFGSTNILLCCMPLPISVMVGLGRAT